LLDDFGEQATHVRVAQSEQLTAEFSDGRVGGGQVDGARGSRWPATVFALVVAVGGGG